MYKKDGSISLLDFEDPKQIIHKIIFFNTLSCSYNFSINPYKRKKKQNKFLHKLKLFDTGLKEIKTKLYNKLINLYIS